MPEEPAVPLLQHKPCKVPELLATQPVQAKAQLPKAITHYTWWDSKDFISISIPVSADLSPCKLLPQQVQCCIQEELLQCTITQTAGHQGLQHRLSLQQLTSAVRPAQSICLVDGQSVPLNPNPLSFSDASLVCHPSLPSPDSKSSLSQHCPPALQQPPSGCDAQPCSKTCSFNQPASLAPVHPCSVKSLEVVKSRSKAVGTTITSQVLIKLHKADPGKVWDRLSRSPLPVKLQPCKHAPPRPESMAALRRALIQQRQERHRQHSNLQSGPVAARPSTACDVGESAEGLSNTLLESSGLHGTAMQSTCSFVCTTKVKANL